MLSLVAFTRMILTETPSGLVAPTSAFTSSVAALVVTFTDASSDSDGSIASWAWAFGDGFTSTAQNPTHTYGVVGTYAVTLVVTDNDGLTGTVSHSVTVASPGVPQDGPLQFYMARNAADFTTLGIAAYAPNDGLYMFDELAGNIINKIGPHNLKPAGAPLPTYQVTPAGWVGKGCQLSESVAKQCFYLTAGEGPNLATESWAWLGVWDVAVTSDAASPHYHVFGDADPDTSNLSVFGTTGATSKIVLRSENTGSNSGKYNIEPTSQLALFTVYRRAAGTVTVYNSAGDKISAAYVGSLPDTYKTVGSIPVASGSPVNIKGTIMRLYTWKGALAESFDDAAIAAICDGLRIPAPWTVPVDGTGNIFMPSTTTHYAELSKLNILRVGRALKTPNRAWPMQDAAASATVAPSIGSDPMTVAFLNGPVLGAVAAGFTRKCASFSAGGSKGQLALLSGVGPNPATTSEIWVGWWASIAATTVARQFMMGGGTAAANELSINTTTIVGGSHYNGKLGANFVDSAGVVGTAFTLVVLQLNRALGEAWFFTKDEKVQLVYGAVVDGPKGFGGSILNTPACKLVLGSEYDGANAEQSRTEIHDLFTTVMRGAPAWSP